MTKPLIPDSASQQEREWFTMLTDGFRTDASARANARRQTREHHDCRCTHTDATPTPKGMRFSAPRPGRPPWELTLHNAQHARALADHLQRQADHNADAAPDEHAKLRAVVHATSGLDTQDPNDFDTWTLGNKRRLARDRLRALADEMETW
jgi:hypothetical protein